MIRNLRWSQTGQFLAGTRVVMALIFGFWIWLAPSEAAKDVRASLPLFAAYLTFAIGMLVVAYRSWWFESRLAWPAFVIDALTFGTGLAITEAVTLDYFSAFMTFFVYLMLSSAMRWGRNHAFAIAGVLALCFLIAGLLVDWRGLQIDFPKVARRFGYLVILSLMLIWFAAARTLVQAPRLVRALAANRDDPLIENLTYAMQVFGANGGAVAWLGEGDNRPQFRWAGAVDLPKGNATLERLDRADNANPMLFDLQHGRQLMLDSQERLLAARMSRIDSAASAIGVDEGLSIPIASRTGRGRLILTGIAGLCSDDLLLARTVAREISAVIDDEETEALAREVAMSRLRSQIATDLHDSVVQTLAGVSFRLEAICEKAGAGSLATEIVAINRAIVAEQAHVRAMMDKLRRGALSPGNRNLYQETTALVGPLSAQWGIAIEVTKSAEPVIISSALAFEIQQIMREAVANAARHGQARTVCVRFETSESHRLILTITDDGKGVPAGASTPPRSISERLARLDGTVHLTSSPGKTEITIAVPMGRMQ